MLAWIMNLDFAATTVAAPAGPPAGSLLLLGVGV